MILGIGSDMCDIARIEKTLARFGEAFEQRVFSEGERAKAGRRAGGGKRADSVMVANTKDMSDADISSVVAFLSSMQ